VGSARKLKYHLWVGDVCLIKEPVGNTARRDRARPDGDGRHATAAFPSGAFGATERGMASIQGRDAAVMGVLFWSVVGSEEAEGVLLISVLVPMGSGISASVVRTEPEFRTALVSARSPAES
jgi:hypothetical protein